MRLLDLIYEALDHNPEIDRFLKSILQHPIEADPRLDANSQGAGAQVMEAIDVEDADHLNTFIRDALKPAVDVNLEVSADQEVGFRDWVEQNNYNVIYYLCYVVSFPLFLDKLIKRYNYSEFIIKGSDYNIPVSFRKTICMYRKTPWKFKLLLDNFNTSNATFGTQGADYVVHLVLNIQRFTQDVDFHAAHWQDLFIDYKRSATMKKNANVSATQLKFDSRMAYTYEKSGTFRLKDMNMSYMNDILDRK